MSSTRAFNTRPLYQQVADEFASRLIRGEWAPGQTIANEADIARSLGISLGTARKAFDILVELDLLERHQGRGTIVPDVEQGERRHRFSNIREKNGSRISGEIEISDVAMTAPRAEVAERLSVNERTPVLSFRRNRRYRQRLFMREEVFLRVDASFRDGDLEALQTTAIRRWSGYDIATSKSERAYPCKAGKEDAAAFEVAEGTAVLCLERVIRSYQDRPLELRYASCVLGDDLIYATA